MDLKTRRRITYFSWVSVWIGVLLVQVYDQDIGRPVALAGLVVMVVMMFYGFYLLWRQE